MGKAGYHHDVKRAVRSPIIKIKMLTGDKEPFMQKRGMQKREHILAYSHEYNKLHPKKHKPGWRKRYPPTPQAKERARVKARAWRAANKEKCAEINRAWHLNNPAQVKIKRQKEAAKRRSTPKGKLNDNIRRAIRGSLAGMKSGCHWETLVGYTVDDLKAHIERRFKPGMTWANYGPYWHIDHKIPQNAFNFEKPADIDFTRCWALKNLQPMWAPDNIRKRDRLEKPFQPALAIK